MNGANTARQKPEPDKSGNYDRWVGSRREAAQLRLQKGRPLGGQLLAFPSDKLWSFLVIVCQEMLIFQYVKWPARLERNMHKGCGACLSPDV